MSGAGLPWTSRTGILFDLDGVLVRSDAPVRRSWARWAAERDLPESVVLEAAHGRRTIDTVRAVAPQLDSRAEAARLEAEQSEDTEGVIAAPGAAALLASLPPWSWAVVTSGTRKLALARLAAAGLAAYGLAQSVGLVCADEVANGKPSPEGYLLGARKIGLPADTCLVFEDAAVGIAAGRAAGMTVVGVLGGQSPGELAGADLAVRELTEVRVSQEPSGRLVISFGRPASGAPAGDSR